ncbi:MAG TPA: NAD(P)-dependent oxidoreductase [Burkholderiales bacterium]|nr:NAD(P)-dependent oxidoreductase [Burkholderiales bacterium]
MKIGIAGIGKMGAGIAARLANLGHEMMVWNRSADKARATGLKIAQTPAELAAGSETVISMLADAAAVNSVYAQMLPAMRGRLFIDMSTVRPDVSAALTAKVRAAGGAFIECPVGGTVGPAREGRLFGFVGGEPADVARARPILEQMCRRIEHLGPVGAGASMKLAINLPLIVYWQALGEALSLIRHLNLDPARAMDILADTSGAPTMMKNRAPAVAAALAGKENAPTVAIDTLKKDLAEMLAEAKSRGYDAPATRAALAGFERASRAGLGAKDCTVVPVHWLNSVLST